MGRLSAATSRLKTAGSTLRVPAKKAENFYQSKEWKAAAAKAKKRAGYKCQSPGCSSSYRIIADHIVERKDGGADFDQANLQVLCMPCHNTKTAKAKTARNRR